MGYTRGDGRGTRKRGIAHSSKHYYINKQIHKQVTKVRRGLTFGETPTVIDRTSDDIRVSGGVSPRTKPRQ